MNSHLYLVSVFAVPAYYTLDQGWAPKKGNICPSVDPPSHDQLVMNDGFHDIDEPTTQGIVCVWMTAA